jgi:hypothetical protein
MGFKKRRLTVFPHDPGVHLLGHFDRASNQAIYAQPLFFKKREELASGC